MNDNHGKKKISFPRFFKKKARYEAAETPEAAQTEAPFKADREDPDGYRPHRRHLFHRISSGPLSRFVRIKRILSLVILIAIAASAAVFYSDIKEFAIDFLFARGAEQTAVVIEKTLRQSSEFVATHVDETGEITRRVNASILGTVAKMTVEYKYEAAIGIDVKNILVESTGNTVKIILPELSVIQDGIKATDTHKIDLFMFFSSDDIADALEEERLARREYYTNDNADNKAAWDDLISSLEETIKPVISSISSPIDIEFVKCDDIQIE